MKRRAASFLRSWEVRFTAAVTVFTVCLAFFVPVLEEVGIRAWTFLDLVELKAWDLHFRQRGEVRPSGKVAFVAIDEESVDREGRWPWPRRRMADLVRAVERYGALTVGLDLGFFEPDPQWRSQALRDASEHLKTLPQGGVSPETSAFLEDLASREDDDRLLSETIRGLSIPVVLGHFFVFDLNSPAVPTPPPDLLDALTFPVVRVLEDPRAGRLHEARGMEANLPDLVRAARRAGSFNVFADPDGAVRWMPLVFRYEGRLFPSLALSVLASAFPELPLILTVDGGGIRNLRLGPVSIPTNNAGDLLVNFNGPSYTFPHVSATALLRGEAPADCLRDRLVIIGNTTQGLHDLRPTPFAGNFPGVELHCTVLENILQQHFLHRSEGTAPFSDMGAMAGLAGLFLILQRFLHGLPLALGTFALGGGYLAFTHGLFLKNGLWLNHVYPVLNLGMAYVGTSIHRHLRVEREKRRIRQTFNLYVHEAVVEEMLAYPERLRLGGEKRELTVLFSDIRDFTALSEERAPEEIVPQLNEYLTRMSRVVFDHHGTLDKYIGDAIMCFFGAPIPQEDHARRACATALAMERTLRELQDRWRPQGKPLFRIGIGINTGVMMVGNMGSDRRFDYTVLGDNVNLASRLEGLSKLYGVTALVSENTWQAVGNSFVGRELDRVRVKGKQKAVAVYELLDEKGSPAAEVLKEPLALFAEALERFRRCEWENAMTLFRRVDVLLSGDSVSRLYVKRCQELRHCPPDDDWDGVTVLDSK